MYIVRLILLRWQAITTADGSKYVGGWKDGRMHGEGELHGADKT